MSRTQQANQPRRKKYRARCVSSAWHRAEIILRTLPTAVDGPTKRNAQRQQEQAKSRTATAPGALINQSVRGGRTELAACYRTDDESPS